MPSEQDLRFMELAIRAALDGQRTPGGECVGAVLARDGEAASVGFNEGEMRHDPTAHAEMVVIRRLCEGLRSTEGIHDLLHTPTLRNVHDGLPVGGHQPNRLWCLAE